METLEFLHPSQPPPEAGAWISSSTNPGAFLGRSKPDPSKLRPHLHPTAHSSILLPLSTVLEELHPVGGPHFGKVLEGLYPMGGVVS